MKYMLDTNICIYLIKQSPEAVLKKFDSLCIDDISISSITVAELAFGVEKSKYKKQNERALAKFLLPLEIFPFDDFAANHYGNIRAFLEKKGKPIGTLDLMIAAHARSVNYTLVTNNVKEFARVPKLKVENWVK